MNPLLEFISIIVIFILITYLVSFIGKVISRDLEDKDSLSLTYGMWFFVFIGFLGVMFFTKDTAFKLVLLFFAAILILFIIWYNSNDKKLELKTKVKNSDDIYHEDYNQTIKKNAAKIKKLYKNKV